VPTFARRNLSPQFGPTQGPIVVGGVGGSGTRAVVEILRQLGVYTGGRLNGAGDNAWFTLLCKLPRWDLDDPEPIIRSLALLERAMQGLLGPTKDDEKIISEAVERSASWMQRDRLTDDMSEDWLLKIADTLRRSKHEVPEDAPLWGWKEPTSHLFLSQIQTHFGDRLRYVHVIRNGVYMAHSKNQNQVSRWGKRFGINAQDSTSSPTASLDFWIRSNEQTIRQGQTMNPGRFFLMNHDDLCASPREHVTRFVEFLEIEITPQKLEELIALPNPPKPIGMSPREMLEEFGEERLFRVRQLGFDLES